VALGAHGHQQKAPTRGRTDQFNSKNSTNTENTYKYCPFTVSNSHMALDR